MLRFFFTVVYVVIFFYLLDLVFRNTLSPVTDVLAGLCLIIAIIISILLADYTVKKIKENN